MIIIVIALVLVACGSEQPTSKEGVLNISVLQFTAHSALDDVYTGFLEGLEEAGLKVETDYVIDYYNAQGDAATTETIANTIVNSKPDLIFAIATPAAQALANKTDTIPIIVAAVTDPVSAGLVIDNEKPETNVSGVSDLTPVKRQIELMKEVAPNVKTVGIMYVNSEDNSRFQADIAKAANIRANEIVKSFSHTRPDGSSWDTVSPLVYAENISYGHTSAIAAHTAFMNSAGHRANIVIAGFKTVGTSAVNGPNGTTYWVVLFGY